MSDEGLLLFLEERGVAIPSGFTLNNEDIQFIRMIVSKVEANPNATFAFGYSYLETFAESIRAAVVEYYGINTVSSFAYEYVDENILQDNDVFGVWNDQYLNYNCYSYAIGYSEETSILPGQIAYDHGDYDPEDYPHGFYCSRYATIAELAELIRKDLASLGYFVNSVSTTLPNITVTDHSRLICVRNHTGYEYGFHLMVLEEDNIWYHKPGATNPLMYRYTPSEEQNWILEGLSI